MDTKLHKLLTMALRADTNDNEADSAFRAARRLTKDQDVTKLLDGGTERVVERVVYRTVPTGDHKIQLSITVPMTFQFAMIERIFGDAQALGVEIELISCKSQTAMADSGMCIVFRAIGNHTAVESFNDNMDNYIEQAERKAPPKSSWTPPPGPPRKKGFWEKLFG